MSAGRRHRNVVDFSGQLVEEAAEPLEVRRVEGGDARPQLEAGCGDVVRVAGRDDHARSRLTRATGRLQPDAGAAADHDDGLPGQVCTLAQRGLPTDCRSSARASHQGNRLVRALVPACKRAVGSSRREGT
jgi:hypothetical protein